jgi:hypothetical protein
MSAKAVASGTVAARKPAAAACVAARGWRLHGGASDVSSDAVFFLADFANLENRRFKVVAKGVLVTRGLLKRKDVV